MSALFKLKPISERNILDIENDRIWISKVSNLNDPYDCAIRPHLGRAVETELLHELLDNVFNELPVLTGSLGDCFHDAKNMLAKNTLAAAYIDDAINDIGICSFLDSPFNITTWSHYGENHKGMCLEYDVLVDEYIRGINVEAFKKGYRISNVLYSNLMPYFSWEDFLRSPELTIRLLLTTKYKDWAYENEKRLICYHHPGGRAIKHATLGLKLKNVYTGCAAEDSKDRNRLCDVCENLGIGVIPLHRSKSSFLLKADDSF